MKNRTRKAIDRAIALAQKASDVLEKEMNLLESENTPALSDDLLWTINHLDQAVTEGLAHHCDPECDHEGHVVKGYCERCGARYESDDETFAKENPR